jgi:nucleoside-diphosphate-sugar epimerase
MKVLIIGGTGLISQGIIKHLLESRHADVTMFNRGQREHALSSDVRAIQGDRNDFSAFEQRFARAPAERFDVVIDMICFTPEQAESDLRAFAGRCDHFIFCSTVCTYGVKTPPHVFVDETFPQQPISSYGKSKLACERIFLRAHDEGKLNSTIIRPSSTYGPGGTLIDNLEFNPVAWDRIERGLPVLCAGDGLGLWVSTHRDDVGALFAHAALNKKTYGQSYNATMDAHRTWRDYYHEVAAVLGKPAQLLLMPASWIVRRDPKRFNLLEEITRYHGAYSSEKARHDVQQFRCEIDFPTGAAQTLQDQRRRNKWRDSRGDELYEAMVSDALASGIEPCAASSSQPQRP